MKKVLIADTLLALFDGDRTVLDREDIRVLSAATSDGLLTIHRAEHADLITTRLDLAGMRAEEFCARIRENAVLRPVPLIMTCADTPEAVMRSSRCGADAVLFEPVPPVLLIAKARQLLQIAARETLRVALDANVQGHAGNSPFYGRALNVSESGMLIETDKRLAAGSLLACQFYLPVARSVHAVGRVVRLLERSPAAAAYQYGLMFTEIAPEHRMMIARYVVEMSRTESGDHR